MITVYGADWCEDTQRSMRHLRRLGIPYHYVNIDEDSAALDLAKRLNGGRRRTPTITLHDRVLAEPPNAAIEAAVVERGLITRDVADERLRVQNVGDLERAVRTGTGLMLVGAAQVAPGGLRWAMRAAGAVMALTGITGWCPTYAAAGLSSLGGPADRPSEAERTAWLASVTDGTR